MRIFRPSRRMSGRARYARRTERNADAVIGENGLLGAFVQVGGSVATVRRLGLRVHRLLPVACPALDGTVRAGEISETSRGFSGDGATC